MKESQKTIYIVRLKGDWESSSSDANYLEKYLSSKYNIQNILPQQSIGMKNKVLFFIDRHHFLSVAKKLDPSNKVISTWWHGWNGTLVNKNKNPLVSLLARVGFPFEKASSWKTESEYGKLLLKFIEASKQLSYIVCSCDEVINRLVNFHQIPREKIVKLPIGVDLEVFKPAENEQERKEIKKDFGIKESQFVIGNFSRDTQMDGTPKWVKDPETLIKVLQNIYKSHPEILVLLTNQRRGFIKYHLHKLGIPFLHWSSPSHADIAKIYKATDLSLITSREEGGPNQLYESWACGVPVVSTAQGMALDWLLDGVNGLMCPVENADCLAQKTKQIIENSSLRESLVKNGCLTAKELDWKKIAQKYDELLFSKIL